MHVEGLKPNLISISQICDPNLNVNFNREKCVILDTDGKCVLKGFRSLDNCYALTSPSRLCHKVNIDDTKLWHQRLGHMNFKTLRKLSNTYAVRGLPKLGIQSPGVCGLCQSIW